jgi:tripartite-type tricarboxylate transporter receptor subunit TctC
MGPAKLPPDVVARLNAEIRKALASPAVANRYKELDTEIDGGTPEEFLALAKRETVKWAEVIKRAGAKVD